MIKVRIKIFTLINNERINVITNQTIVVIVTSEFIK
jgi:hypothetical protein